jgi:hypothetical protein
MTRTRSGSKSKPTARPHTPGQVKQTRECGPDAYWQDLQLEDENTASLRACVSPNSPRPNPANQQKPLLRRRNPPKHAGHPRRLSQTSHHERSATGTTRTPPPAGNKQQQSSEGSWRRDPGVVLCARTRPLRCHHDLAATSSTKRQASMRLLDGAGRLDATTRWHTQGLKRPLARRPEGERRLIGNNARCHPIRVRPKVTPTTTKFGLPEALNLPSEPVRVPERPARHRNQRTKPAQTPKPEPVRAPSHLRSPSEPRKAHRL